MTNVIMVKATVLHEADLPSALVKRAGQGLEFFAANRARERRPIVCTGLDLARDQVITNAALP